MAAYDKILNSFEPNWPLLDAVTEPSLVNYDIWTKNIMLRENDGQYVLEGIIDHERAFYGDPLAEFISTSFVCGDLKMALSFRRGYSEMCPFVFGRDEQLRYWMYHVYMGLLMGVEIYRYRKNDVPISLLISRFIVNQGFRDLKNLS